MFGVDIAIEPGSSQTGIYLSGTGAVLSQPTIAAFSDNVSPKNYHCGGYEAKEMLGKTPERIVLREPVQNGIITDKVAGAALFKDFIRHSVPNKFLKSIRALVCVPCGLTKTEKRDYEDVFYKAGCSEIVLIESVIAAAIGAGLPVVSNNGLLIADIGGGTTDIAVISMGGIISGCSVNIGGIEMDKAIIDIVKERHNLKIGRLTAEKLKEETGSLYSNDLNEAKVNGIDIVTKSPAAVSVAATDILDAVEPYYQKIVEAIESVMNTCPPEVASDIYNGGLVLTGGGACMPGIEQLIGSRLKITVKVAESAQDCVLLGAAKLLCDEQLLNAVFDHN